MATIRTPYQARTAVQLKVRLNHAFDELIAAIDALHALHRHPAGDECFACMDMKVFRDIIATYRPSIGD